MVIADKRRIVPARTSVNQFLRQSYQNKRLIIINSTGSPVTNRAHEYVREELVDPLTLSTLGALRNYGIMLSDAQWICPWDDDDHSHPHRLTFQMAHRQENACCLLSSQVRADVTATPGYNLNMVCLVRNNLGLANTIIFPKNGVQYDETLLQGVDAEFFTRCFGDNRVVLENDSEWFPGAVLSFAFWHGLNVASREEFLGQFAGPQYVGIKPNGLTDDQLDYVAHALGLYGYKVEVKPRATGSE